MSSTGNFRSSTFYISIFLIDPWFLHVERIRASLLARESFLGSVRRIRGGRKRKWKRKRTREVPVKDRGSGSCLKLMHLWYRTKRFGQSESVTGKSKENEEKSSIDPVAYFHFHFQQHGYVIERIRRNSHVWPHIQIHTVHMPPRQ